MNGVSVLAVVHLAAPALAVSSGTRASRVVLWEIVAWGRHRSTKLTPRLGSWTL